MAGLHKSRFKNPVVNWIDARLPVFTMMNKEYATFPTPKNFNYFWNFGALATIQLLIMIVTGVFLAMYYTPNTHMAFDHSRCRKASRRQCSGMAGRGVRQRLASRRQEQ